MKEYVKMTKKESKKSAIYFIGRGNENDAIATKYLNGVLEFNGTGDFIKFDNTYDMMREVNYIKFAKGNNLQPTSLENLFTNSNIEAIDFSNLDTSHVKNIDGLFNGCGFIKVINLSNMKFNLNVPFTSLIRDCYRLEVLNLANIDFGCELTTEFDFNFRRCSNLRTIDFTGWEINDIRTMLREIDLDKGCSHKYYGNLNNVKFIHPLRLTEFKDLFSINDLKYLNSFIQHLESNEKEKLK